MISTVAGVVALLGSGLTAGVLFAVALSVVPALRAMPTSRYIDMHRLLGRNWDPTMPITVLTSALADVTLAVLVPSTARTVLFALAAGLLLGVSCVSQWGNVPINRWVKGTDSSRIPVDWRDPRPAWRRLHLLRTVLAILALLANAVAQASGLGG